MPNTRGQKRRATTSSTTERNQRPPNEPIQIISPPIQPPVHPFTVSNLNLPGPIPQVPFHILDNIEEDY